MPAGEVPAVMQVTCQSSGENCAGVGGGGDFIGDLSIVEREIILARSLLVPGLKTGK